MELCFTSGLHRGAPVTVCLNILKAGGEEGEVRALLLLF